MPLNEAILDKVVRTINRAWLKQVLWHARSYPKTVWSGLYKDGKMYYNEYKYCPCQECATVFGTIHNMYMDEISRFVRYELKEVTDHSVAANNLARNLAIFEEEECRRMYARWMELKRQARRQPMDAMPTLVRLERNGGEIVGLANKCDIGKEPKILVYVSQEYLEVRRKRFPTLYWNASRDGSLIPQYQRYRYSSLSELEKGL